MVNTILRFLHPHKKSAAFAFAIAFGPEFAAVGPTLTPSVFQYRYPRREEYSLKLLDAGFFSREMELLPVAREDSYKFCDCRSDGQE